MAYARFKRVKLAYAHDGSGPAVTYEHDCAVDAENVAIASAEDGQFTFLELKQLADTSAIITVRGSLGEVVEKLDAARRHGRG